MDKEQARQHIRAHERIANDPATRPDKRYQHLESARYLRDKYEIPEPQIIKAIPPTEAATDFERLKARHTPRRHSKPTNWTTTQRYQE